MRDETCGAVRTPAAFVRAARELVVRQPRSRLALLAAIGAASLVAFWPRSTRSLRAVVAGPEEMPVLVAKVYIPAFQSIRDPLVQVRYFPRDYVPPGALHALSELQNEAGQWLFRSAIAIPENQPLTRALLAEQAKKNGMALLLRPGKVAASFAVERARGAGGWVAPGDTIAVFETMALGSFQGGVVKPATKLLLSSVYVLAVDRARLGEPTLEEKGEGSKKLSLEELSMPEPDSHVLTVLTTPAEAAALIEARERGPLSVVLRAAGDDLPWAKAN